MLWLLSKSVADCQTRKEVASFPGYCSRCYIFSVGFKTCYCSTSWLWSSKSSSKN